MPIWILNRKKFLACAGLAVASGFGSFVGCGQNSTNSLRPGRADLADGSEWDEVRARFPLSPDYIHLSGLLLASHPDSVGKAIAEHRRGLDRNPALYVEENNNRREDEVRQAAADYLGTGTHEVALTDSTTMGIGLVYNGVKVRQDQEMLTTDHDYHATHDALQYKSERSGAPVRRIALYGDIQNVSEDEVLDSLVREIRPQTRVVALTWVHSSTGLKIPIGRIAGALAEINADREEADRALLCVDGVHGLGVEQESMGDLNCDFFMAGTHKWLFGPRGTGIIWGNARAHNQISPTIPTFTSGAGWGGLMTPGGFHSFEHRWALTQAFQFHQEIGKARVAERIHSLSRQLKEGLASMSHVHLYTPVPDDLSAGIVCFDIEGWSPAHTVSRLRERGIVASETPYSPSYARVSPAVFNSLREIEFTLKVIADLG